jgi:hypothetical protein
MGPQNQFQGMNSASLCSLAGQYDNPLPSQFLAPIDSSKIPAQTILQTFPVVAVLDEPYSAKPAQLHRMNTIPAYLDWRTCTATPLRKKQWIIFNLLDPDPDCDSGSGLRLRIRIWIRIHSTAFKYFQMACLEHGCFFCSAFSGRRKGDLSYDPMMKPVMAAAGLEVLEASLQARVVDLDIYFRSRSGFGLSECFESRSCAPINDMSDS